MERKPIREEWASHWGAPPYDSFKVENPQRIPAIVRTCGGENIPQSIGGFANSSEEHPLSIYYRSSHTKKPFHIEWQPAETMPDWAVRNWDE